MKNASISTTSCLRVLSVLMWRPPPLAAVIYLESIRGALDYDAHSADGSGREVPFHFLTEIPSTPPSPSPSPSPPAAPSSPPSGSSSSPLAFPSSDVFDRVLARLAREAGEIRSAEASDELLLAVSFGRGGEDERAFGRVGGAWEAGFKDRQLPDHTDNDSNTAYSPSNAITPDDSSSSLKKFSDLNLIRSKSNYVYYDSKQARFGADIGPPGSFDMVHLILPPRGLWGDFFEDHSIEVGDAEAQAQAEAQAEAEFFLEDERSNSTAYGEYATESANAEGGAAEPANYTLRGSGRRMQHREMETIDEFLGLTEPSSGESDNVTSNSSLFDQFNETVSSANETETETETDALQNATATSSDTTNSTLNETSSLLDSSSSNSSSTDIYISDYFCLEDFVEWMTRQQARDQDFQSLTIPVVRDGVDETADSNATSQSIQSPNFNSSMNSNTTNNSNYTSYTRPLAILALRGRCSFSSKAQMAMLLNELFASNDSTARISHVVVYNNGTAHEDHDEEYGGEKLIDMGLESQTSWMTEEGSEEERYESRFTVGMLYVATTSGRDLIRRMKERGEGLGAGPYLDVKGLLDGFGNDERSRNDAAVSMDDSTSQYNDTIHQDVSNAWTFPATLTRFCLSCGPERNYGFDPSSTGPEDGSGLSWDDPHGYYGGHWNHPDGWMPPQAGGDPYGDRDPYGNYGYTHYIPQEWVEAVRKLMISVLAILVIGPFVFAAWRWRSVGGTIRLARDENGTRRLRLIAPNLEVFVNGIPGTVEENGTKLDRSQVFALPEMEFRSVANGESGEGGESGLLCEIPREDSMVSTGEDEDVDNVSGDDQPPAALAQSPPSPSSGECLETGIECLESGLFVSSTCCSICIEEFEHGERLRVLPRCNHPFHTECILPWLTERQGCCPLCKTPVLPDEFQRSRRVRQQSSSNSRTRNRLMRSFRGRVHQPQSVPAETTNDTSDDDGQLAQELQQDMEASPVAISPDQSISEPTLQLDQSQLDQSQLSENDLRTLANEEHHASDSNSIQNSLTTTPDGACGKGFDRSGDSESHTTRPSLTFCDEQTSEQHQHHLKEQPPLAVEERNYSNNIPNMFATMTNDAYKERFDPMSTSPTPDSSPSLTFSGEQTSEQKQQEERYQQQFSQPNTNNVQNMSAIVTMSPDCLTESIPEQAQRLQQSLANEMDGQNSQTNVATVCGDDLSRSNDADVLPEEDVNDAAAHVDP